MKPKESFSRYNLLGIIFLFYLLPSLSLVAYNVFIENNSRDWNTLSIGIFVASLGSLIIFLVITTWEYKSKPIQTPKNQDLNENKEEIKPSSFYIDEGEYQLTQLSLEEAQKTQIRLLKEIDHLTEQFNNASREKQIETDLKETLTKELEHIQNTSSTKLEQQQRHIRELQGSLAEQKSYTEQKQQQINLLESKVNDLAHEIKTLLQFAESRTQTILSSNVSDSLLNKNPEEQKIVASNKPDPYDFTPSLQLKRCIDMAQKIMASQKFGSQLYSFLESPTDHYSLDMRRLCDRFRSETKGVILLYSPTEHHLLFASNQIKDLTGWSQEKFTQNFKEILVNENAWKKSINELLTANEIQIELALKSRSSLPVTLKAHLGMIPSGIFRNYIIAVIDS